MRTDDDIRDQFQRLRLLLEQLVGNVGPAVPPECRNYARLRPSPYVQRGTVYRCPPGALDPFLGEIPTYPIVLINDEELKEIKSAWRAGLEPGVSQLGESLSWFVDIDQQIADCLEYMFPVERGEVMNGVVDNLSGLLFTPAQILGLTGAAEARSELTVHGWRDAPMRDMLAVMCVPINRVRSNPRRFGATVEDVCFEHDAFSCWNPRSGSNHDWVVSQARAVASGSALVTAVVRDCIAGAQRLLSGVEPDLVRGATHYYSPLSMVPAGRVPVWARGLIPIMVIGGQLFFVNVP